MRIGRASDAYPFAIPHCIARRMRSTPATVTTTSSGKQSAITSTSSTTQPTDTTGIAVSNTESSVAGADGQEAHDGPDVDDGAMEVDANEETPVYDVLDVSAEATDLRVLIQRTLKHCMDLTESYNSHIGCE